MALKPSITVSQHHNPKFDDTTPTDNTTNPAYTYRVDQARNTTAFTLGTWHNPADIEAAIAMGVDVTIKPST